MLFKRFRIIKTTRPAPAWLNNLFWFILGLVFIDLALLVLFEGYRLFTSPFVPVVMQGLLIIAALATLTEIILKRIATPTPGISKSRQVFDLTIAGLIVLTLLLQRFILPVLIAYAIVALSARLSRAGVSARFFGNLHQRPLRMLVSGFTILITIGTLLLTFPGATVDGRGANFITALFTATSAISTTGLVVVDTGSYWTLFGQLVLLCLIQIGGIGYMTFIAFIILGISNRLSLNLGILFRESITQPFSIDTKRFVRAVVAITLLFEVGGALLLFVTFSLHMPLLRALYWGIFHSVSAFCTAGFALAADSFTFYRNNLFINLIINLLTLAGALGFFVIFDLYQWRRRSSAPSPRRLSTHTKLALAVTAGLVFIGTLVVLFAEWQVPTLSLAERLLAALFQSISAASTTGFNTVDIGRMTTTSLLFLTMLMFIGASPGGTGGGIKTTTFGVIFSVLITRLKNRSSPVLFGRRVTTQTINTAVAIAVAYGLWATIVLLILTLTEGLGFLPLLFEVASALGTVGLSTGITSQITLFGKILLILTMFLGRVGPFALAFAVVGTKKTHPIVYPEADVIVG